MQPAAVAVQIEAALGHEFDGGAGGRLAVEQRAGRGGHARRAMSRESRAMAEQGLGHR